MLVSTHGIIAQSESGTPSFSNTKSILLDGIDDFVTMGNPASLQITGNMSISTWINTTDSSSYEIIVGKDGILSGTRSYFLFRSGSNAKFLIFRGGSAFSVTGTSTINDGNWHHIVGVNDGTNLKIYVDGALETTTTSGGSIDNGNNPFYIGRRGGTSANQGHFSGLIDETSIFNAELSASDVTSIYNSGVPNDISSLSPLSWWRFEGTGTTATDSGSGGNNGTLTNGVTRSTDVP